MGRALDSLAGAAQIVVDASSQSGRNLEILKKMVGVKKGLLPQIRGLIEGMSRGEVMEVARGVVLSNGDPGKIIGDVRLRREILKAREMGKGEKFLRRLVAARIQVNLSGPQTHVVNAGSNSIFSTIRPAEMMWSGTVSSALRREGINYPLAQQGWDIFYGNFMYLNDAWTAMKNAFRAGDSMLDPHHVTDDRAIRLGVTGNPKVDVYTGLPSRFLVAADEFFKVFQYKSYIRAKSLRRSRELGISNPADVERLVVSDIEKAFDVDGAGINLEALEWSQVNTFTNDLGARTMAGDAQQYINKHPWTRLFLMFWRTPANLTRAVGQRTPLLARRGRQWKMDMEAGGERALQARAREQMGFMWYTTAAMLALSGRVTGYGPRNPNLRREWLQTHKPYAIRLFGHWIPFKRLDPIMSPFALVADAVDMFSDLPERDYEQLAATILASITASIADKTYWASAVDAIQAFASNEPGRMAAAARQFLTGTVVPAASRQFAAGTDPYYREAAGLVDEFSKRVPGISETLEPTRNINGEPILRAPGADPAATEPPGSGMLAILDAFDNGLNPFDVDPVALERGARALGRAISPFPVSKVVEDDIADEMLMLGRGIGMPSRYLMAGEERVIDLKDGGRYNERGGQSPYDRALELQTTRLIGGMTMRQARERMVRGAEFRNLPPGTSAQPGGARFDMHARLVHTRQNKALMIVAQEYPTLRRDLRYLWALRNAAKYQGEAGVERVQNLFGVNP
jgi:hypothetical protein